MSSQDLSTMSLAEMFKLDAEAHLQALTTGLLGLEQNPDGAELTEACMRAAHSIKGGARVIGLEAGVKVAHAMEDCFVLAQQGDLRLRTHHIDVLLQGIDLLQRIADTPEPEMGQWEAEKIAEIDAFVTALAQVPPIEDISMPNVGSVGQAVKEESDNLVPQTTANAYRAMRVNAENLNRLLALAGASRVESQRLKPLSVSLQRLKKMQHNVESEFLLLTENLLAYNLDPKTLTSIYNLKQNILGLQNFLSDRHAELDLHDHRSVDLSHRLYEEALTCRMRPFSDVTLGLPRMVRDLGRVLGKEVILRIQGENTQVDRDVLQKLEAPLGHLLRNAVDHGIETPEERCLTNKPEEAQVLLEARHHAGMLLVTITDDGRGVNLERIRKAIVKRGLTNAETASTFGAAELLDFLFLPSFTLKDTVTEISGRGVGLDAVQEMLKQVRGSVQISTELGMGTSFRLRLPLTLSVLRTLLVEIKGEPYAFPLAQILQALKISIDDIEMLEGRQYFQFDGHNVGLVAAHQVLELGDSESKGDLAVVVIGEGDTQYGLAVGKFLGEQELVVQRLDPRLGKIPNIAAGSLMEDGSPVLIVDVEDMIRSVGKLISESQLSKAYTATITSDQQNHKRVLVVDDSLTVRELER